MRAALGFLLVGLTFFSFSPVLDAQISQTYVPLPLQGEARPTQIPPNSTLSMAQCDGSGEVYLGYATQADNSQPLNIAAIDADGTTQTMALQSASDGQGDSHTFLFTAAKDGSLHEIVRLSNSSAQDGPGGDIEYATYDSDGSLRSKAGFNQEFIPSLLLPLPDGDFFASGVTLKDAQDGVSESAQVGIFNSDAQLVEHLRKSSGKRPGTASGDGVDQETDTEFNGGIAKLGSDGNVYVLLLDDHAKLDVVSESGRIVREMKLQEPFETDVAHDMWISGNRILVIYEGEADDPKDAFVYVLYDAQSGNVIRVYRPEFSGTVACFQDGQTLSVLLPEPSSGKVSLGTAELQ